MRIDAHAHIASWPNEKECVKTLLASMKKYRIDYSLVSNCDCSEYLDNGKRNKNHLNAMIGAKKVLRLVKKYPSQFGCAIWVNPHYEKVNEELIAFIKENRSSIYALKIHPYESRLKISDKRILPYLDLARLFSLPIIFHTANDEYSDISMLLALAKENQDINFVAAHLQLCSDNKIAIACLKEAPNLYADTAWVPLKNAKKVLLQVGETRIHFGTDEPIDGLDTLNNKIYQAYFKNAAKLPAHLYHNLMANNAISLFHLPIHKNND